MYYRKEKNFIIFKISTSGKISGLEFGTLIEAENAQIENFCSK